MKVQVKKVGGSLGIILPSTLCKYHDIKENDWIDMSDIIVVPEEIRFKEISELRKNG